MADLSDESSAVQVEETQFRAAVSESLAQKLGKNQNFMRNRMLMKYDFSADGNYNVVSAAFPKLAVGGLLTFLYDVEIIDVWMSIVTAGSGGTTELDLKRATSPGGAFTSIFTTTPKITSAAGNNVWIHVGSAIANTTAPVLSVTDLDAEDALRMDIISAQTGAAVKQCKLQVDYRPR